jgi:hypothetical protein
MAKGKFSLLDGCDPLAAIGKNKERPVLFCGSIERIKHPFDGKERVMLCTTDSFIAAYVPLDFSWRGRTRITLSADALAAFCETGELETAGDNGNVKVNGETFSPPDTYPVMSQLVPDHSNTQNEGPDQGRMAWDPQLHRRLALAIGARSSKTQPAPTQVSITHPLRAFVVVALPGRWGGSLAEDGAFGLMMPVRI